MADNRLIESYLAALRSQLTWRTDADEIEAEMRDHLYTAVERSEADGLDNDRAQRDVLERFGDSAAVAVSFLAGGTRGMAVPTVYTRAVGAVGMLAAVAWVYVVGAWSLAYFVEKSVGWSGPAQVLWVMGAAALLPTAAATVITITALQKRHGGLGIPGFVGLALAVLGAVASFMGWFIYGWGSLIGFGALLVAATMFRRGLAPRLATIAFGGSWLIGGLVAATLWRFGVGGQDEWGDYPLANNVGLSIGGIGFAIGVWRLSRWLRSEEPVDAPANAPSMVN